MRIRGFLNVYCLNIHNHLYKLGENEKLFCDYRGIKSNLSIRAGMPDSHSIMSSTHCPMLAYYV